MANRQRNKDTGPPHNSFDPTRNIHLWTMFRVAINDIIAKKSLSRQGPPSNPYKPLTSMPYQNQIRLGANSQIRAEKMSGNGLEDLTVSQFVYYGLPRVKINDPNKSQRLPRIPLNLPPNSQEFGQ